jgi:hypothetical protein
MALQQENQPETADSFSRPFYAEAAESDAIMRAANFPNELLCFLQQEALVVSQALRQFECDSLVELGCYDGRLLQVARMSQVLYFGVDLSSTAVAALRDKIAREGIAGQANAFVGDVTRPQAWLHEVSGLRPLFVFPFNLLGNLSDPAAVVSELRGDNRFGVVSVFNSEDSTTMMRDEYYAACGIEGLSWEAAPYGGVRFRGNRGFVSQSFGQDQVSKLMADCGVRVLGSRQNRLGQCLVFALMDRKRA